MAGTRLSIVAAAAEVIYHEVAPTNVNVSFVDRHSSASFGVSYGNTKGMRYLQIIRCPPLTGRCRISSGIGLMTQVPPL